MFKLGKHPWILPHFKDHIEHTGGYSGVLEGKERRPCQLLELRKLRPGARTSFVWYNISDGTHQVVARIDREAYDSYFNSDHDRSQRPLVILQVFKSEWSRGSNPNDDPYPVITVEQLGHYSSQDEIFGAPQKLSHALYSWWELRQRQKEAKDTDSPLASERALSSKNPPLNLPTNAVAGPSNLAKKRRNLLDRWPNLVLSEETCSISKGDMQLLSEIGFAGSLKDSENSRLEETVEDLPPDVSIPSDSDDTFDWPMSPEQKRKHSDGSDDIQVKEESDDEEVPQQKGSDRGPSQAQDHATTEARPEVTQSGYTPQSSGRDTGLSVVRPAILVPDSDTSMTQSTHSQSLSQAKHIHHLPLPSSSIEHPPYPQHILLHTNEGGASSSKADTNSSRPPAPVPTVLGADISPSKEGLRSSTPLGFSSSSPSNLEDRSTSPDRKSTSSKARAPKLKSRPSWAKAMTNEEVNRCVSTPLRDPRLGFPVSSPSVRSDHPSAHSDDNVSGQDDVPHIKDERQSQPLLLRSSPPQANVVPDPEETGASGITRTDERRAPRMIPRVLGARTTAHRTTAQKYQELSDILSEILSENGRKS